MAMIIMGVNVLWLTEPHASVSFLLCDWVRTRGNIIQPGSGLALKEVADCGIDTLQRH
jgi:hypothetical protein